MGGRTARPQQSAQRQHARTQTTAMEKPTSDEPQKEEQQPPKRDLLSLPDDLLRICARSPALDKAAKRNALASCKPLSRAVLHTSLSRAVVDADRGAQAARSAKLLLQLWGEEEGTQREDKHVTLVLCSAHHARPEPCLVDLRGAGVCLPFITDLHLEGLALDALLPSSLGALLPNLSAVTLTKCQLTASAKTSLLDAAAPLSRLQKLRIGKLSVAAPLRQQHVALATAQLRQLAKLPSLSAVTLKDASCPTLFLLALATQLTRLTLDASFSRAEVNSMDPAPAWRATLQQAARCTRLEQLSVPITTARELVLLAPALRQVRRLSLMSPLVQVVGPDDGELELLLGLPHLTALHWERGPLTLKRWLNDAPCRWEQLGLGEVTTHVLAGLPLRSLKRPVQWATLEMDGSAPALETRAAVAIVTRPDRCPAGFRWAAARSSTSQLRFSPGEAEAEHLQALRPLLAPLTSVSLSGLTWDEGLVTVLGQVLPRTCTRLEIWHDEVGTRALREVARSLPWLQRVTLEMVEVRPGAIRGYAAELRRLRERGQGAPHEVEVVLRKLTPPKGVDAASHRLAWAAAALPLQFGGLALRFEW